MSLTALTWLVLYCAAAVFTFVNPVFGALGYLLEYYMRPELRWWGDELPPLRWNLIISLAFGASFLLRRSSLPEVPALPNVAAKWLVAMASVMAVVTCTVALNFEVSLDWSTQWVKMALIFPLLLTGVLRTRNAFNLFVLVNMLGAFNWGWEAWMDPKRSQGRLMNVGSGDSFNDNEASAHLLTILPLIVVYLFAEKDKRLRAVALIALPFVVNTLILCNSRGAMVGLAAAVVVALLTIRSGFRMRALAGVVALLIVGFSLADQTFLTRQQTTANYKEDGSAQGRLDTWAGGLRLLMDYPLGAGGRGFHMLSPAYIPDIVAAHGGDPRAPHNTYVMVPAEWGLAGLVCFLGLYASAFLMLRKVKKRSGQDDNFYYWRAFAIQSSLVAYLVASVFADRLYGEAGYWLIALSYALLRMQAAEQSVAGKPVQVQAAAPAMT